MVIYVDVLFIVNFFVNYFLLGVTAKFCKFNPKTSRLILSSVLGGLYSLIILADNIPPIVLYLSKFLVAVVMLLVAFRYYRVKTFLLSFMIFAFANLIFLGLIIGVCITLNPSAVVVNNSVVYFDISARGLLVCSFFAYLLSCVVVRIHNRRLLKKEIYTITVFANSEQVTLYAFLDTGNKLREPFSDTPVIIADKNKVQHLAVDKNIRLIPTSTVNSHSLLTAFKADKVVIKSSSGQEVVENIYIALSEELKSDSYSAILNPEILHI